MFTYNIWIYTTVHFVIFLYSTIYNFFLYYWLIIFISFLLTTISVTLNICNNNFKYLCLILSSINELILIFILIYYIIIICAFSTKDIADQIFILIVIFLIESIPNIILFIYFYEKSKNENYQIIDNNNNNSRLINI